jgi:putative thioredoxin
MEASTESRPYLFCRSRMPFASEPGKFVRVAIDVTDADFEQEVLERSDQVPVVVDLWAPWCGPCRTLGPILEDVIDKTEGSVVLAKVNVDENPRISAAFQVQSIPAVVALKDRKVVDGFIGAVGRGEVEQFVSRLAPAPSEADELVAKGDEDSLKRALELEPNHPDAIASLARLYLEKGEPAEALKIVARIPENPETRQIAAEARLAQQQVEVPADGVDSLLESLLDRVKEDEAARQEFLDLLETLGPDDTRTAKYRKALAARLF